MPLYYHKYRCLTLKMFLQYLFSHLPVFSSSLDSQICTIQGQISTTGAGYMAKMGDHTSPSDHNPRCIASRLTSCSAWLASVGRRLLILQLSGFSCQISGHTPAAHPSYPFRSDRSWFLRTSSCRWIFTGNCTGRRPRRQRRNSFG